MLGNEPTAPCMLGKQTLYKLNYFPSLKFPILIRVMVQIKGWQTSCKGHLFKDHMVSVKRTHLYCYRVKQ